MAAGEPTVAVAAAIFSRIESREEDIWEQCLAGMLGAQTQKSRG